MNENTPYYKAIIVITLPNVAQRVKAQIVIAPNDVVPLETEKKRLYECTLADLQDFADELEESVWKTYQDIRLIDLAHNDDDNMTLMLIDENGAPVKPERVWFKQTLVWVPELFPDEPEIEEPVHTPELNAKPEVEDILVTDGTIEDGTSADEPAEAGTDEQVEEETAVSPPPPPEKEPAPVKKNYSDDFEIKILTSEPVTSYDALTTTLPGTEVVDGTHIRTSKARVRIAGERLPLNHNTWKAVDILVDEPALRASQAHALSSLDREVAGVMIGPRPEKQPDGRYVVHVIDTIIAKYTVMQGASVTYTPESWRYMNDKLMERYPDETAVIVGWYHTHPGFGIFLSGMDQFIHQNFFTQKWHIAFVLDPRAKTSGFFCWDKPQTRVSPYEFKWPKWANGSW
jgi:proteasome lid subunit RPN8/RPN11